MLFIIRRFGGPPTIIALSILAGASACSPVRPAYFQPEHNVHYRSAASTVSALIAPADSLPQPAAATPAPAQPASPAPALPTTSSPVHATDRPAASTSRPALHRNPDSQPKRQIRRLLDVLPIDHVPLRSDQIDRQSPVRKTHRLGVVALGLSVLAYAPLLLAGGGTLAWTLGLTLPLAAVLLGIASITTIHRNKDRYRGKGWAMAAIIVGTGAIGLALVAAAALSVSRVVWEK